MVLSFRLSRRRIVVGMSRHEDKVRDQVSERLWQADIGEISVSSSVRQTQCGLLSGCVPSSLALDGWLPG